MLLNWFFFLTEVDWSVLQQREWLILCSTDSDLGRGGNFLIQQWVKGAKRRTDYCTGSWTWPLFFLCEENRAALRLAESKRGSVQLPSSWAESRRRFPTHWNLVWAAHSTLFSTPPAGNSLSEKYFSLLDVCLWLVENQSDLGQLILLKSFHTFHF